MSEAVGRRGHPLSANGEFMSRLQRHWVAAVLLGAALCSFAPPRLSDAQAGAMQLDGQFSVGPTGSATYQLPIAVPPGTAGMQPSLTLDYDSRSQDGLLGVGWSLGGLLGIGRCPQTIEQDGAFVPVGYSASDRFCLDDQRLMAISGTYGADGTQYRTEVESFTEVISHGTAGNGPAWFEVHTKSGQTMEFGNTTDSRIMAVGPSGARIWALDKVTDSKGNYFTVTYNNNTTTGEYYPTRIDYTGNAAAGLATYASVQFVYAARPTTDQIPVYLAGAMVEQTQELTDIQTYDGSTPVLDYALTYAASPATNRQRLASFALCTGNTRSNCPQTTNLSWASNSGALSYSSFSSWMTGVAGTPIYGDVNGDGKTDVVIQGGGNQLWLAFSNGTGFSTPVNTGIVGSQPQLVDMTGHGKTDLLTVNSSNQLMYYPSTGSGFGPGTAVFTLPVSVYTGYLVTDLNGDGRPDLIYWTTNPDGFHYALWNGSAFGTAQSISLPSSMNLVGYWDHVTCNKAGDCTDHYVAAQATLNSVQLANFTGHGATDLVLTYQDESQVGYYGNDSQSPWVVWVVPWWGSAWGTAELIHYSGNVSTATAPADVNGDSLTDLYVWSADGNAYIHIPKGNGGWTWVTAPVVGGNCPNGLQFADMYGSGLTDMVCQTSSTALSIARSNGSNIGSLASFLTMPSAGTASLVDLNGDGRPDIVYVDSANKYQVATWTGVGQPDVLTGITGALGTTTTVSYQSIAQNGAPYTKGSSATYPTVDIDTSLYVVNEVDVPNGQGGTYRTTYSYQGAQVDAEGRGFLGFKQMTVTDPQTGIASITNYRTDFPYTGLVASESKILNSATLSQKTNTYADIAFTGTRAFPYLSRSVSQATDLDGSAMPTVTTTYQYDSFGNNTQVVVSTPDGASKTTPSTYTNDTTHWFLGRLTQAQVASVPPGGGTAVTRTSSFAYDPTTGLLTQEVIEPNTPSLRLETDYGYDAFGNKVSATVSGIDIASRTSTTAYDSQGRFPITVANALGQQASQTFEPLFGNPASATDANSLVAQTQYDSLGRKTLAIAPDGTRASFQYTYCSGVNGGTATCPTGAAYFMQQTPLASDGVTHIGPVATAYFDKLERQIEADSQGADGSAIKQVTTYNALGQVVTASRPYFATGGTAHNVTYTYDALGRVLTETAPDGSVAQHAYHGLSQTDTNALGQTRTAVKDSQGNTKQVTDALNGVTSFAYDAFQNLVSTTDPLGHVISASYDLRGRKIGMSDPDLGQWTYGYDTLGELVTQTDAKGQVSTLTYDQLGRVTSKTEPDLSSTWAYDSQAHGVGKLAATNTSAGFQRSFTYDSLSRPIQTAVTVDGSLYATGTTYDANGRMQSVTYPSGFGVTYSYTATGYLNKVADSVSGLAYWTANTYDAESHLTQETLGNGLADSYSYDANTGRLLTIQAGASGAVENASYHWDPLGNLTQRIDLAAGLTDTLTYDGMNRLTQVVTSNPSQTINLTKTVAYDATGNITSRSDLGSYSYDPVHVHAVTGITGSFSAAYVYDADGNMTSGGGRTIAWTSFNMVAEVVQGTSSLTYVYGSDHARIKQTAADGSFKYYLNDPVSGAMAERSTDATGMNVTWNDYIMAGGAMVAMHAIATGGIDPIEYFHRDHLGSIAVVTDANGNVLERDSYDAWGKRRYPTGLDSLPTLTLVSQLTRGFTGQEQMDSVGLVNFNGRVYDPTIGRFLSADPFIQAPDNSRSYNRYSYLFNNPLSGVDPSGYFSFGSFFGSLFRDIGHLFSEIWHSTIGRALLAIAGAAFGQFYLASALFGLAYNTLGAAVIGGAIGGAIGSGNLKGAIIGAVTAAAFWEVGTGTWGTPGMSSHGPTLTPNSVSDFLARNDLQIPFNIIGHAAVGCVSSVASGGQCGPQALAGAVGVASGFVAGAIQISNASLNEAEDLVASTVGGGIGSVAGGAKFANGAITGAFGYLFNNLGHLLVGQDAHQVLLDWLQSRRDGDLWSGNTIWDGLFGTGRPDLVYSDTDPLSVYEIKPDGSAAAGAGQLQRYVSTSDGAAVAGPFGLIFGSAPSLTLSSQWFFGRTTYTYTPSSYPGIITYTVNNQSVFQDVVQAFQQRPAGGPSPLPLPVPVLP